MKKSIALVISLCGLLLVPSLANAHPGRTDSNGGHTCRTNCERWGYEYGEYHYHNGGGSSSNSSSSSSTSNSISTPTPKPAPVPKPKPKPVIDEKQVKADRYYEKANAYYAKGEYKKALKSAQKIYSYDRNINKAEQLTDRSLEKLYDNAQKNIDRKLYKKAEDDLYYIYYDSEYGSENIKKKASLLFDKVVEKQIFLEKIKEIEQAQSDKEYEDAFELLNDLKKESPSKELTKLYDNTLRGLQKEAETSFKKREYESAKPYLNLLTKVVPTAALKAQYAAKIKSIDDQEEIMELLGLEQEELQKNSLFEHLIVVENETPRNEAPTTAIMNLIMPKKLDFIKDIYINDLFKGGNENGK